MTKGKDDSDRASRRVLLAGTTCALGIGASDRTVKRAAAHMKIG